MEKKTINTLLLIASAGLAVAGMIFLLLAIFNENANNWVLFSALTCIALSNLFNLIRISFSRKDK